jgi:hypothetical protein
MDQAKSKLVEDNPIGDGLDAFRPSFNSICNGTSISCIPDTLGRLGDKGKTAWPRRRTPLTVADLLRLSLNLLVALQNLPAASLAPSRTGRGTLESELLRHLSAVTSDNFDFDRIKALLSFAA